MGPASTWSVTTWTVDVEDAVLEGVDHERLEDGGEPGQSHEVGPRLEQHIAHGRLLGNPVGIVSSGHEPGRYAAALGHLEGTGRSVADEQHRLRIEAAVRDGAQDGVGVAAAPGRQPASASASPADHRARASSSRTSMWPMTSRSPPTVPSRTQGTSEPWARFSKAAASSAATLTMIRDWASPKSATSARSAAASQPPCTVAPIPPRKADSATATASPPSDRSCAERSCPAAMDSRTRRCSCTSKPRSIEGRPATRPWT